MNKRRFRGILAASALALAATATGAYGQAFPSKIITVLSPIGASQAYEIVLRSMADMIQQKTGKSIIFEPAIGAGGSIAPQKLARAEPDGHTIAVVYAAPLTLIPQINKDIGYDPLRDFAPITMLTRHGIIYLANLNVPANNAQELIALAKTKPGQIKAGFAGTGSRIGYLQVAEAGGVKFLEVPYKAANQLVPALLSGEIDLLAYTVGEAIGLLRAGKVKALYIGSKNRSALLPNVPSISDTYPNIEIGSWFALIAPAKTPADRIDWHHREWNAALRDPKTADRMVNGFGYEIVGGSPQQLADQVKAEIPVYTRIVKEYNITQ